MKRNLNNPDDKKRLIELLLECPSIRDKETRYAVLGLLPTDIANAIKTSDIAKVHVFNIVNTCINFSNGINELFEAIAFFDDKTEPFQELRDFLENNKVEEERQRQAEDKRKRQTEIAQQKAQEEKRRQAEIAQRQAQEEKRRQAEIAQQKAEQKSCRYIDNGDGTVTDNRTGLIWLKNANCFGRQDWETAMQSAVQLADGQRGLSDGSKPGDWRLPTIEEWEAMVDDKYQRPVLSNAAGTSNWKEGDAFSNVQSHSYWSSTTDLFDTSSDAGRVALGNSYIGSGNKANTNYVWPVRCKK